jgi:coenzyme F420 hydrogenase subunit beta
MQIRDFFTPIRCRLCFDKLNVFSDISVGRTCGISQADHKNGECVCIVRTEKGLDFLQKSKEHFLLREVAYDKVCADQRIENKRREWYGYRKAWGRQGMKLPNYCEHIRIKQTKINLSRYKKKLKQSLILDSFGSTGELTQYVDLQIQRQDIYRLVLMPFMILVNVVRKIKKGLKMIIEIKKGRFCK